MHRTLGLVFDCDDRRRAHVSAALAVAGCAVQESAHVSELAVDARRVRPDIVIIGFREAQADAALLAIDQLHRTDRRLSVVLVTTGSSEETAIAALRAGVKDYLREPLDTEVLAASVRRCLASEGCRRPDERSAPTAAPARTRFIGSSRPMQAIGDYLERVAQSEATVLITGETGTGKELAAERIHDGSSRRGRRFVSVNCAAIPDTLLESELFGYESGAFTGAVRAREGLLQLANRGTIFLDEVGDLALQAQAKLLRAIEAREVYRLGGKRPEKLDVRIVAATNQDLDKALEDGRFRKDLYFRLNVTRIHLPPLRERRSDIVPLLDHYLQALNRRHDGRVGGFSPEAVTALQAYDWPGNVRELKNLVEAILVSPPAGQVAMGDLPDDFRRRLQQICNLPGAERRRLMEALLTAKWNKSKAATLLHCSRMTLYRKMAKYSVVTSDDLHRVSHRPVTLPGGKPPA